MRHIIVAVSLVSLCAFAASGCKDKDKGDKSAPAAKPKPADKPKAAKPVPATAPADKKPAGVAVKLPTAGLAGVAECDAFLKFSACRIGLIAEEKARTINVKTFTMQQSTFAKMPEGTRTKMCKSALDGYKQNSTEAAKPGEDEMKQQWRAQQKKIWDQCAPK